MRLAELTKHIGPNALRALLTRRRGWSARDDYEDRPRDARQRGIDQLAGSEGSRRPCNRDLCDTDTMLIVHRLDCDLTSASGLYLNQASKWAERRSQALCSPHNAQSCAA